jgi:hypothetical protein
MILNNITNNDFDEYKCYFCKSEFSPDKFSDDQIVGTGKSIVPHGTSRFKCNCGKSTKIISCDETEQISIFFTKELVILSKIGIIHLCAFEDSKYESGTNLISLSAILNEDDELSIDEILEKIENYVEVYNGTMAFK